VKRARETDEENSWRDQHADGRLCTLLVAKRGAVDQEVQKELCDVRMQQFPIVREHHQHRIFLKGVDP
jgi:hypothetical protein